MSRRNEVKTLAEWRQERGLTLEQVAERVGGSGFSKSAANDYEKGRRMPGIELAYKIAAALEVEVTQIADWRPERTTVVKGVK